MTIGDNPGREHLRTLVDGWLAQRDEITERIELAERLISMLDDTPTTPSEARADRDTAGRRTAVKPPAPAASNWDGDRPRRRRIDTPKTCPDCGQVFPNPGGFGSHRRAKHPGSTATPPHIPTRPTTELDLPRASYRDLPGKVLRCEDCGLESPGIPDLARHTLGEHGREPRPLERTPVRPRPVAV